MVRDEMKMGQTHYNIILTETKNSLMKILSEDLETPKAREVFTFVMDEMVRMQFISPEDATAMKNIAKRSSGAEPDTHKRGEIIVAPEQAAETSEEKSGTEEENNLTNV
jgi:hypothetical protein